MGKKLLPLLFAFVIFIAFCASTQIVKAEDFHIGIVTGSVSQSEDDRRGAEAFQAKRIAS